MFRIKTGSESKGPQDLLWISYVDEIMNVHTRDMVLRWKWLKVYIPQGPVIGPLNCCSQFIFNWLCLHSPDYATGVPRGEKALGYVSASFIIHLPFSLSSMMSPCASVGEILIWTSCSPSVFHRWISLMGRTWPPQWTSPACRWELFMFLRSETSNPVSGFWVSFRFVGVSQLLIG